MRLDLTGRRFGRLTAERVSHRRRGAIMWECVCDCGNRKAVRASHLSGGFTSSCGCFRREFTTAKNTTHGLSRTPEHRAWLKMRARCEDPNNNEYHRYGGRGVKVCEEWQDFAAFLSAMGNKPTPEHTIDRIDCNGDYDPSNCRWATRVEQQNNKRNNHRITICGETKTIAEWERAKGLRRGLIGNRLAWGWNEFNAVMLPLQRRRIAR